MKNNWIEGEDYYYNEQGFIVLTAKYHLDRGHCCGNGCWHCPYNYKNVNEPKRSELLSLTGNGKEIKK
ncbi:MAG TPA: DUF5522 domain-containing protein [Ferruginibacter sp.]|nr:DUF5522 domain-containing protein [Ferruginibacter sp.]